MATRDYYQEMDEYINEEFPNGINSTLPEDVAKAKARAEQGRQGFQKRKDDWGAAQHVKCDDPGFLQQQMSFKTTNSFGRAVNEAKKTEFRQNEILGKAYNAHPAQPKSAMFGARRFVADDDDDAPNPTASSSSGPSLAIVPHAKAMPKSAMVVHKQAC